MMDWSAFANNDDIDSRSPDGVEHYPADGVHHPTIGWVRLQSKEWAKKPSNKDGMVLTVRLDFGRGTRSVFDDISCDRRGLVEQLCRSARVHPPASGEWDESQLNGQVVTVETTLRVSSKTGKEYVGVSYKANAAPLPAAVGNDIAPRANRTPTQKADAASNAPNDDIPF